MNFQQLEYIIALDNLRSFVKAADECCVTQPNLTTQVKKLEEELGVQIFDRQHFPIHPTKIGEQIILQARQILRAVTQLKEIVANNRRNVQGSYRLGVIPTLAPYLLPLFLKDFLAQNPAVQLSIEELQTHEIAHRLKNDLLDVGILATPLSDRELREIPLFHEPLLLYISPEHSLTQKTAISPADLPKHELLLLKEGHCLRNQIVNLCSTTQENAAKQWQYESGSLETLKRMVEQNLGFTLIPELSVDSVVADVRVRRFAEPQPLREISVVVRQSYSRERFLDVLHTAIVLKIPPQITTLPKNKKK
jgi:LysR family hydrogen peroxide-inducible transcriptional activator